MADVALLQVEGSQPVKAVHYVPLTMQLFFTGLVTQRNPFSSLDNRYNRRFLGGRPEQLSDGLNIELTNYGTIIRRPGVTPFSTATLPSPGQAFYSFHDLTGTIRLMADTVTQVSVLTPTANNPIFTKSAGSGQTDFQSVGNTLYFGDGVDLQAFQPNVSSTSTRNWGIAIGSVNDAVGPTQVGQGADAGSFVPWTNPNNVTSAINYATVSVPGAFPPPSTSGGLNATMAGNAFSVPQTSAINGIQVSFEALSNLGSFNIIRLQLLKNGNPIGAARFSSSLTNVNATYTVGGTSDLWETTWVPNDVNQNNFGVQLIAINEQNNQTVTFSVRNVQITIFGTGGPTIALVSGPLTTTNGGYQYVFSYGNSNSGHLSSPTPPSVSTGNFSSKSVQVSLTASTDPQVNQIRVFRTKDGGSVYFELPTSPYPNTTQNITDSATDAALQQEVFWPQIPPSIPNTPPPAGFIHYTYHLQRIWGAVGNFVFYAAGPDVLLGNGNEAFPPANNFLFPSLVVKLVPYSSGLLVFTTDDIFVVYGTNTATFYAMPWQPGVGILGENAIDIQGSNIFLYTSDRQGLQISSSGINEIGFPIGDLLQTQFDPNTNIHVAAIISGTSDKAVFIGDSVGNWFRCNWNQAPEGGPAWSPKATIQGGFTHFQAVETSPGIHQLLMFQNTGGGGSIVLFRDFNNYSDNGTPYSAFFTLGSLVLAQPGQLSEVVHIVTEQKAIGSPVSALVLIEEIAGTFESLPEVVPDPPGLTPSVSVISQRFYLNQSQQTVDCRHLQVKIVFAQENAKNEILSFSLFGRTKYHE